MESTVVLGLSLVALLILLVLGATIFLALLHTKATTGQLRFLLSLQERTDQFLQGMLLAQTEQSEKSLSLIGRLVETTSSSVSDSVAEVLQQQSLQHQQSMAMLQKTVEAAMFGISSSATEMSNLTKAATTLLGTKDPLAYQMAMGAQASFDDQRSNEPYTSTQVDAEWQAEQAQMVARNVAAADAAIRLMTDPLGDGAKPNVPYYAVS
jgi:hypothetical protein